MSLRTALIGFGHGGEVFHAPLIDAAGEMALAAIVTRDPERRARAARAYPGARLVDDAEWVWAHAGELDLVVVATPNRTHVPLALAALDARLPCVVDKPFAATAADARGVIDRFAECGLMLTVFHNRRWDGDFLTAQRLVAGDALGRVLRFESRFERWRPSLRGSWRELSAPEEAGGLLFDLGTHLIDQALVLFGPATHVYAELDRSRDGARVDDDDFVAIRHASGVRSHLWMSAAAAQQGPRYRMLGTAGAYTKFGMDVQEDALRAGMRPGDPAWGEDAEDRWGTLGASDDLRRVPTERGAYDRFYPLVADAIERGAPPPVDPQAAIRTLEIIEAARVSSSASRVVPL